MNFAPSDLEVAIYVKPGASKESVGGTFDELLVVAVTAPAIDGRANAAVEKVLAHALGVRPSAVVVIAGASSRRKRVRLHGVTREQVEALREGKA